MSSSSEHSANRRKTSRSGWIHFAIAVTILAGMGFGWEALMATIGEYLQKEPVPWPAPVRIDKETCRNISLPDVIGPYTKVTTDGELFRNPDGTPKLDGQPDGETILPTDILSPLKINTSLDKLRYDDRTSNWYLIRTYKDTRDGRRFKYWGLDIYYYTGSADTVPHVAEVCGAAGGATPVDWRSFTVEVPHLPAGWSRWEKLNMRSITLQRTLSSGAVRNSVQFYCFSVNGEPAATREAVRLNLAKPWQRYVYFAKIQWYPLLPVVFPKQADQESEEFIRTVLPVVLKQLPTAADLKRLGELHSSEKK
jgi:hypothetical protein